MESTTIYYVNDWIFVKIGTLFLFICTRGINKKKQQTFLRFFQLFINLKSLKMFFFFNILDILIQFTKYYALSF